MQGEDLQRLRNIVRGRLESLQRAGVSYLPKPKAYNPHVPASVANTLTPELSADTASIAAPCNPSDEMPSRHDAPRTRETLSTEPNEMAMKAKTRSADVSARQNVVTDSPKRQVSDVASLEILQHEVANCTRCEELAGTRTQTVFGVGNPHARLCFLGEAPGADEDRTGIPFVGRAGQLLTKIIEACTLKREDVYILNMIKCRPPGNRNPLPQELANCRHFLERQLELIEPKYICCLGAVAAQNLLETQVTIGKLRGKIHDFQGIKVVCTYHPAYLLRNPAAKKDTWDDMKLLMREMGIEL